ncbi:MAG: hypothetical protein IRZ08_19910, partial [Frankia sp.]|nr:hypothetical protein [Frankia sp.]
MAVPTTLLPAVLTDWAADLRAGRIGPTAGGVGAVEPAWAASGAMALTGHPDAAPLGLPVPLVARLDGALAVVRQLAADLGHPLPPPAGSAQHPPASAGQLLGERAAAAGLARQGQLSAGGAARLLPAADGWVAVNLARIDDLDLLPAWLEQDLPPAPADRPDSSRPGDAPRPGGDEPGEQAGARPWASLAAALATRPAR